MSDLKQITEHLHQLRQRHSRDVIEIGRLLVEAKGQVPHGQWLTWLDTEFAWSRTTAERFIRTYEKFGKDDPKSPTLGVLNLEPSTICLLAEKKTPPEAVKAVLDLAETEPVSHREAVRIVKEVRADLKPPPPPKPRDTPLRDARAVEDFSAAVASLSKLAAKPATIFTGIAPQHELEMLANFLAAVAAAEQKAA